MGTARIEAFSDGVIAVIITIMVLELKVPPNARWETLIAIMPGVLIYALSFVVVAIFWVNHHHLLHAAHHAGTELLWSNIVLLFCMSLVPFVTAYLAQERGAPPALVSYALVLGATSAAFAWLIAAVARHHIDDPMRSAHFARMRTKARWVILLYALSVPSAYLSSYLSYAIFVLIPALYFLPDRKLIE